VVIGHQSPGLTLKPCNHCRFINLPRDKHLVSGILDIQLEYLGSSVLELNPDIIHETLNLYTHEMFFSITYANERITNDFLHHQSHGCLNKIVNALSIYRWCNRFFTATYMNSRVKARCSSMHLIDYMKILRDTANEKYVDAREIRNRNYLDNTYTSTGKFRGALMTRIIILIARGCCGLSFLSAVKIDELRD